MCLVFFVDDISDFVYLILEAEKQAKEDPSEDKDALRMLNEKHFLGILSDMFLGETLGLQHSVTNHLLCWASGRGAKQLLHPCPLHVHLI